MSFLGPIKKSPLLSLLFGLALMAAPTMAKAQIIPAVWLENPTLFGICFGLGLIIMICASAYMVPYDRRKR